MSDRLRKLTSKMPLRVAFVFLSIFVFPLSFLVKKTRRKSPPNYREKMIDRLDAFTPEFRFEIPHGEGISWLTRRKFEHINITSADQFGFSIAAVKQS